jgi:hypothetical protein
MTEWKSQPLATLKTDIGEAVASLNTVVVGLDAVENGHEKPETLDISWGPHDKRAAARKARKFVVEAVLVRVFEALFEHTNLVSRLPRLGAVVRGWDGKTKRATKIWDVYKALLGETYLVSAAVLICHWRNRIVHPSSGAKLLAGQKRLLQESESEIAEKYRGLSVDCILCHFEEARPTLKDVSILIAMTINLAKETDKSLSSVLAKEDFDAWMEYFDLKAAIKKVEAETKPEKRASSIRRVFRARAPMLLKGYEEYYPEFLQTR